MDLSLLAGLFGTQKRLHGLEGEGDLASLVVEGWVARERLSEIPELRIVALSDRGWLDTGDMISRPVSVWTALADGQRVTRSGLVRQAELLGGDGGLARYRLTVVPWLWLATQQRNSRIYEGQGLLDVVLAVLGAYEPYTVKIAPEVAAHLEGLTPPDYTTQYRETDYDFVSRLLTQLGLGWTVVEDEQAPGGHAVSIFADSRDLPEDISSASAPVRFHRSGATESHDTVQSMARRHRRTLERVTLLGWHAGGKHSITAESLVRPSQDGGADGALECYEFAGHGAFADAAQAEHHARVLAEAAHARAECFLGYSTVRSFRSGTRFRLADMSTLGPADEEDFDPVFALDALEQVGINDLPRETQQALKQRMGDLLECLTFEQAPQLAEYGAGGAPADARNDDALALLADLDADTRGPRHDLAPERALLRRAQELGYANRYSALRCDRPWRPDAGLEHGRRLNGAPIAHGVHTALVVGDTGQTEASDGSEILRNARGDVRVRFPWQNAEAGEGEAHSRWVRVAQRQAGAGMGMSFVPRLGQEVLLRFLDDDIDQPMVVGTLYNGRGEGGVATTPGGRSTQPADDQVFASAQDQQPSAHANLAGGAAPAWHGASAGSDGHRNAAALSGFKTREFGGGGYNQLVFDDTDDQLRVQLKTTQAASELNLGHLIHQAGNYRGSLRGVGAELRTDGHGAIRGGAGVLISTYHGEPTSEPAGEVAGGQALARDAQLLGEALDKNAGEHRGVRLAAAAGAEQADSSVLDGERAPLAAWQHAVSGTADGSNLGQAQGDAGGKHTAAAQGKVAHITDPVVMIAAKEGLAQVAGQNIQVLSGEAVHWSSGQDSNWVAIGALRVHSGQAAGMIGGSQSAGEGGVGLQLISAEQALVVQAQDDVLKVQARDDVKLSSESTQVEFGALKRIRIATQGGASILIEGGNITVKAPGRIEVESGDKKFAGPDRMDLKLSAFSDSGMYTRSFVFKDELGNELPGFDHLLSRPQAKERMSALLQGQSRAVFTAEPEELGADLVFPKIEIGEDTL